MSKAQEALDALQNAGITQMEMVPPIMTVYFRDNEDLSVLSTLHSALTLMAALEAVPGRYPWALEKTALSTPYRFSINGAAGYGHSSTEAIQNALSKLTDNGEQP